MKINYDLAIYKKKNSCTFRSKVVLRKGANGIFIKDKETALTAVRLGFIKLLKIEEIYTNMLDVNILIAFSPVKGVKIC